VTTRADDPIGRGRVAWFSPLPPSTSGIAAYSAELMPLLRARGMVVDTFTEETARDFVWKQRRHAYALTLFQMGNASCHDFMWAYLFRYPGMVVLHDAQLHQARALWLTRRWRPRRADYLAELRASHPEAPGDLGELVAAGLGAPVYQHFPLIRLVVESAKLTVVHNDRVRSALQDDHPHAAIEAIAMGVADPLAGQVSRETIDIRARHAIPRDAIVVAAFGGITPEKRITQLLSAVSALADRHALLHVLLVGAEAAHYDVRAEAARWQVADRVHVTGYVRDEELPDYLLAADVCACLRWPTNRETSASWLRCLAAGRPTIITELAHLVDVPTLDPRGWQTLRAQAEDGEAVAVSIDVLDENHSLQLALERLVADGALRRRLARRAREWWHRHHRLEPMADAYERLIARAIEAPVPAVQLPAHLRADGSEYARSLGAAFGVGAYVDDALGPSPIR
jgi:glycosyltransferase involved in cell wall biosynthesis